MLAVDTNLVVRLVTNDEARQARRALAVFRSEEIFIPKTALLETEWVLRFSYELDRASILRGLRGILGLASVSVEDGMEVAKALELYEAGLDFADALHLCSSAVADRFGTFDTELVRRAKQLAPIEVVGI